MADQTLILVNELVRQNALKIISNLPIDGSMQVVIGLKKKVRTSTQNGLQWSGMLADIAEQAWLSGRQFSKEVWHRYCKIEFLPEGNEEDFDRMVLKGYRKWDYMPDGERILVGSTTMLTTYGMGVYMDKCHAFFSQELGVRFHVRSH